MNKELKNLRLRQVDQALRQWMALHAHDRPSGGWIRSIRQALGMSTTHLARRMGISRQGVAELERREVSGGATLASLEKAARAMGAELVYAIVPRSPLADTLRAQARRRAEHYLGRVAHSMRLEAQDVSHEETSSQLAELQDRLLRNWSRHIWDEEEPSPRRK
jgi:predicted DNA-binding mobile mystery protein A